MLAQPIGHVVKPGSVTPDGGWNGVFGNENPLNLEIGVGGGEFLLAMAERNPNENYVGLDISGKYLKKAARKAGRTGLNNVRFLVTEAKACMTELFEHESLSAVYVNFPDPWPKQSHERRRHFDSRFLALLEDRLVVGGYLYLATDVEEYAAQAFESLSTSTILVNGYAKNWLNDRGWQDLQTKYEKRWADEGKTLHYLAFRKNVGTPGERFVVERMPFESLVLADFPLEKVLATTKDAATDGNYLIKFLSAKRNGLDVRARIILIDKTTGARDFLHAIFKSKDNGSMLELENPFDMVYTGAKHRALMRIFETLALA